MSVFRVLFLKYFLDTVNKSEEVDFEMKSILDFMGWGRVGSEGRRPLSIGVGWGQVFIGWGKVGSGEGRLTGQFGPIMV